MDDNSLKFIDLFAGCGGLSLGLEKAGFKPVLYSELNQSAADSYQVNRKDQVPCISDVYKIKHEDVQKYVGIDLVCGGPPCQGYSGIGIRRTHKVDKDRITKNILFLEMIRVINLVKPRIFLFENVKGILTGKWNASGKKGQIFEDVLGAFQEKLGKNYYIRWDKLKSSLYGIPQSRPRVFIVGIHKSIEAALTINNVTRSDKEVMGKGFALEDNFLPKPTEQMIAPGLKELLSDLVDENYMKNGFKTKEYLVDPKNKWQEEMRVKKDSPNDYMKIGETITEQEYSRHKPRTIEKFKYMLAHNGKILEKYKTKKFSQRLLRPKWDEKGPSITVTSLPDDYVHYSQPRILTVREWARLQTFPDWYKFEGIRTTGGARRSGMPNSTADQIETPKYTQIGNAVPVKLANLIGEHLKYFLQ